MGFSAGALDLQAEGFDLFGYRSHFEFVRRYIRDYPLGTDRCNPLNYPTTSGFV
jgi:hypothetical protein